MSEIKSFSIFSLALLAIMLGLFYTNNLGPIPGFGFILGTMAVLSWWVSYRLNQTWKGMSQQEKAQVPVLNELRWFFIIGALFFTIDIIPHVILVVVGADVGTITIVHWAGHVFLFTYNVLGVRIALSFFNPRWKNPVTIFVALVSAAALAASALYPDTLVYLPPAVSKYPLLHSNHVYAAFNMVSNILSIGLFGVYLVFMGLFRASGSARTRAVLMGIGLLCEVVSGFYIQFGTSPDTPAYLFTLFTFWGLFTGVAALDTIRNRASLRGARA